MSRSPHGERGLKSCPRPRHRLHAGRSPHGERGLKFHHGTLRLPAPVALLMESVD